MKILLYTGAVIVIGSMYLLGGRPVLAPRDRDRSARRCDRAHPLPDRRPRRRVRRRLVAVAQAARSSGRACSVSIGRSSSSRSTAPECASAMHFVVHAKARLLTIVVSGAGVRCAAGADHPAPKSYAEHMAAAEHHEGVPIAQEQAARHTQTAPDRDLRLRRSGALRSADQRHASASRTGCHAGISRRKPRPRIGKRAEKERAAARNEREQAAALAAAEQTLLQGHPGTRAHASPFAHRKAIAQVIPHREGGVVRGVRVVFKPVAGLTVDCMEQAIACHQARFAALGKPATYMAGGSVARRGRRGHRGRSRRAPRGARDRGLRRRRCGRARPRPGPAPRPDREALHSPDAHGLPGFIGVPALRT